MNVRSSGVSSACRANFLPTSARPNCRADIEGSTLLNFTRVANTSTRAVWTKLYSTQHISNVNPNLGEVIAALMAIEEAKISGPGKIILERDSSTTINTISHLSPYLDWIDLIPIISDIRHI